MLTDRGVKALKPQGRDYTVTENTRARKQGRLLLRVRPSGTKEWFFVYWIKGRRRTKKLGTYPSLSLVDARDRAGELSKLYQAGIDVREHLAEKERVHRTAMAEAARRGTLGDLLESYLSWMEANGRRSVAHVRRSVETYVTKPFPILSKTKAKDITPDDIQEIIARMLQEGVTTHANRVRSYLHAAFQHGLRQDHNPRNYLDRPVGFGLTSNPVSAIPRQDDFERVGERTLTREETQTLWESAVSVAGPVAGAAIKLALATGGQRTGELLRLSWTDIDFEQKVLTIPELASKNGRAHVVPLGSLALEVLETLHDANGDSDWLFPSRSRGPFRGTSLSKAVRRLCDKVEIEPFTPRDLRRTAKTLMGEAGLDKAIRDRLQNHSFHDVSTKHYDRYSYLPEKRRAVLRWDRFLAEVAGGKSVGTVLELKR